MTHPSLLDWSLYITINRAQVLAEAGEDEEIIYAKIGEIQAF